jgi:DNA-directed RNA polymerase specialized sigma24 family protein
MGSLVSSGSDAGRLGAGRSGRLGVVRAPWRQGAWSPEEVARTLSERREGLYRLAGQRQGWGGIPAGARREIVDEAICVVVMSRRKMRSEEHLLRVFWTAASNLLCRYREGRHLVRVGSRERVDFELVAARMPAGVEPFDAVELHERAARAADFMSQLSEFERQVVMLMAAHGLGVKLVARTLGAPVGEVKAAVRSADEKLDRVAVIAAAGRLCSYREPAIVAEASGVAGVEQTRVARVHLEACGSCRQLYVGLRREMRGREFQRRAAAAFTPGPAVPTGGHEGWYERLLGFWGSRPAGGGAGAERAAGMLGGGGLVKAAATGTAILVVGAGVGSRLIHSITASPTRHHHHRVERVLQTRAEAPRPAVAASLPAGVAVTRTVSRTVGRLARRSSSVHRVKEPAALPNREAGAIAIGEPAGESSAGDSGGAQARIASNAPEPAGSRSAAGAPPPEEAPPRPRTGGGTNQGYLGG